MTSEGSDRGSEPIRDAHRDELEKGCDAGQDMAGMRKSGNDTAGLCDNFKKQARPLVVAMLRLWYSEAFDVQVRQTSEVNAKSR